MIHRYQGYCPDETQPDARDAECEACQSMDDLTMPELRAGIALQLREIERLRAKLAAADARAERLESALTPRKWTKQQSHVWHCTMPDVDMAFEALRIATLAEGDGKS